MNIDPISIAEQKTKWNATLKKAEELQQKFQFAGTANSLDAIRNSAVITTATENLANLTNTKNITEDAQNILKAKELPIQPDPELIKKQAMAVAQTARAQAEQLLQQRKEEEINKLKQKAEKLAGPLAPAIGMALKLGITDPKHLATIAYEEAKEKIREAKQKASKENLKKAKEAYSFPMKPPLRLDLGELPKLPEPPKIPEIPKAPKKNTCDDFKKTVNDIETKLAAEKVKKEQNKKEGMELEEKGLKGTPAWNAAAIGYLSAERQIKTYEGLLRNAQQLLKGC